MSQWCGCDAQEQITWRPEPNENSETFLQFITSNVMFVQLKKKRVISYFQLEVAVPLHYTNSPVYPHTHCLISVATVVPLIISMEKCDFPTLTSGFPISCSYVLLLNWRSTRILCFWTAADSCNAQAPISCTSCTPHTTRDRTVTHWCVRKSSHEYVLWTISASLMSDTSLVLFHTCTLWSALWMCVTQ